MTVKRRVIWLTDEEWATAQSQAADHGMTVSAYVRLQLVSGLITGSLIPIEVEPPPETDRPAIIPTAYPGNPDAVRVTPDDRFNSQPFTGPIPKKR